MRTVRHLFLTFAAALGCLLAPQQAAAAELRITLNELAGVVQAVLGPSKLHLDNKPGGLFSGGTGSSWTIAGKETAIPLPAKSFRLMGSTYAYYVEDLNSKSISVTAAPAAVRLMLAFEDKAADLKGACVSGDCGLAAALPKIIWKSGTVTIDVVPVRLGSSITLQVKNVAIGGLMSAKCGGAGIIADGACSVALTFAKRTIANLKPEIAATLKAKVNDSATQEAVANGLKTYLAVGPAGEIAITGVTSDAKSVRITFALPGDAGG
ncbi:MAG: hypothetical protein ABL893_06005 [Hyphomicrobium sp.]